MDIKQLKLSPKRKREISIFFALLTLALLATYFLLPKSNHLEKVINSGKLNVVTRNSPTTLYQGADGPAGLEYDLAKGFADSLGVELNIKVEKRFSDILPSVASGQYDFAAAGLTVTNQRKQIVRFTTPYQQIIPQAVRRIGNQLSDNQSIPRSAADIKEPIHVINGSSHMEDLMELKKDYPQLQWIAHDDKDVEELLYMLWDGEIAYTTADSNELKLSQRFFPELRVAFNMGDAQQLAWAFKKQDDDSLHRAANEYLKKIREDGTLTQILERHYGHTESLTYVGTRYFMAQVASRLPRYRHLFKQAGEEYGIDWRLLAAISYQESHWNANAVSPTGVRGLMMLTNRTAGQMGIDNRLNPRQSIFGGAKYITIVKEKIPEDIQEPDRTWMALASYNVGFGHLEDARKITESLGGDPHAWVDVMKHLPKLSIKKWYKHTKYGYARGYEPVQYVQNIRGYHEILVWLDERQKMHAPDSDQLTADDLNFRGL